jgi:hypothetical protein
VLPTALNKGKIMTSQQDVEQLKKMLSAEEIPQTMVLSGFQEFSDEVKDALVEQAAQTFEPPLSGKLVARLIYLLTDNNRANLQRVFVNNLRSPDPEARKASLYGLEKLEHPALVDFALHALRDDADQMLAPACDILLRKAERDPVVRKLLRSFYEAYKDKPEFYSVRSLLEAHGIDREPLGGD